MLPEDYKCTQIAGTITTAQNYIVHLISNSCSVNGLGFEPTLLNYPVSDPKVNALSIRRKQIFTAKSKKRNLQYFVLSSQFISCYAVHHTMVTFVQLSWAIYVL